MRVQLSSVDLDAALKKLLNTYAAQITDEAAFSLCGDNPTLVSGERFASRRVPDGVAVLLPWRLERRFIELKNLIENQTLENVSTLRFAALRAGADLGELLYREFDLCEWIGGGDIVTLYASFNAPYAANVIAKLANGITAAVEVSSTLPAGSDPMDRHEIIAARGVASDRAVDTQVPQHSMYVLNASGEHRFTDTDAELYGLSTVQATVVRAAFTVLTNERVGSEWETQHVRLGRLIAAALRSDADAQRISLYPDGEIHDETH